MNSPCFKCDKRKLLCHESCEEYQKYLQERKVIYKKKNDSYVADSYLCDERYKNWKSRKGTKRRIKGTKD